MAEDLTKDPAKSQGAEHLLLKLAVKSDVGMQRTENQDSYGYLRSTKGNLFIVCDGMGGARGGATASAMAVDIVAKNSVNQDGLITEQTLRASIEKANSAIFEASKDNENLSGMGTTLVALGLIGQRAMIAHVGDSRIYMLRGRTIYQLTRDHTLVQELVDSGAISEEEAANHPIAHMLSRSLGPTAAIEVELRLLSQTVEKGDKFLLCCDGLYNLVTADEMIEIIGNYEPGEAAKHLVDVANQRGGTDNITVEVVEVTGFGASAAPDLEEDELEIVTSATVKYHQKSVEVEPKLPPKEEAKQVEDASVQAKPQATLETNGQAKSTSQAHKPKEGKVEALRIEKSEVESGKKEQKDKTGKEKTEVRREHVEQLERIQYFVLGAVLLSLLATVIAIYPRARENQVQIARSTVSNVGEVTQPQAHSTTTQQTQLPINVTPIPPIPTTEMPNSASEQSWPQVAVVPEGAEVSNPQGNDLIDAALARDPAVERAMLAATRLDVSESAPTEMTWFGNNSAVELVDWNQEAAKRTRVITQNAPRVGIMSDAEKSSLVASKVDIRSRITLIDERLKFLDLTEPKQLEDLASRVEDEIVTTRKASDQVSKKYDDLRRRYYLWLDRKTNLDQQAIDQLGPELSQESAEVERARATYKTISLQYLDAVERWRSNLSDDAAAARMAQLGRELETELAKFKQVMKKGVDQVLNKFSTEMADALLIKSDLQSRVDLLNRLVGIIKGTGVLPPDIRASRKRELLAERSGLLKSYKEFTNKVPHPEEQRFRLERAVKQLAP
ncbi:Stp1/IreP family PP2C-type Ser/Thr phosphatase [bacterium]|nr:Stp1/IreP family PP2C-type Ser/Thr phosphatase [bacterium]